MEVAWQAYYDPHHANLDDFIAPGLQDLSYLGLELVVRCSKGSGGGVGILALLLMRQADICRGWVGWFIGHPAGSRMLYSQRA